MTNNRASFVNSVDQHSVYGSLYDAASTRERELQDEGPTLESKHGLESEVCSLARLRQS